MKLLTRRIVQKVAAPILVVGGLGFGALGIEMICNAFKHSAGKPNIDTLAVGLVLTGMYGVRPIYAAYKYYTRPSSNNGQGPQQPSPMSN